MINIRPVSDLRNKYPEIEDIVLKGNGYGTMVIMSIKKYETIMTQAQYTQYIESALDEADEEIENPQTKYYTEEEIFSKMGRIIDGEI